MEYVRSLFYNRDGRFRWLCFWMVLFYAAVAIFTFVESIREHQ